MTVGTNFVLSRSLTTRNPVRIDGDTAGAYILPQTLDNSRVIDVSGDRGSARPGAAPLWRLEQR